MIANIQNSLELKKTIEYKLIPMIAKLIVVFSCTYLLFLEELKCALIDRNFKFDQSEHTSTLLKKVNTKKWY